MLPRTVTFLRAAVVAVTASAVAVFSASPAFAQAAAAGAGKARPWHYWMAFFLLLGFLAFMASLGVGYYFRVIRRRGPGA